MSTYFQRKYTDLINQASSKWVNWDPLVEIRVGAYGSIDKETGNLQVEGSIYDPAFQAELDKQGVEVDMTDFLPREGQVEDDLFVASRGARRRNLTVDRQICSHTAGPMNRRSLFTFRHGKRDALLIVHRPRRVFLPPDVVLESLYRIDKLVDKCLVTSICVCPEYSMYLSSKSGDKITLARESKDPINGIVDVTFSNDDESDLSWNIDAQSGLLREGSNASGDSLYTPLFEVKCPVGRIQSNIRWDSEPSGDELWQIPCPPWEPLDEDGEEDPIDVSMEDIEPFDSIVALAAQGQVVSH